MPHQFHAEESLRKMVPIIHLNRLGLAGALLLLPSFFPGVLRAQTEALVTGYQDGDDVWMTYKGRDENVRLIGIDAPEKSANEKAIRETQGDPDKLKAMIRQGKAAAAHMKTLVHPGETVTLVEGVEDRDKYGRLLAYVYLPDGRMLNELMMEDGYAVPLAIEPNTRYKDLFEKEYEEALENKRGLWSQGAEDTLWLSDIGQNDVSYDGESHPSYHRRSRHHQHSAGKVDPFGQDNVSDPELR